MEFLFEFIFDLIAEGVGEASKSPIVPKPVRIALTALIVLFFIAAIGLIIFAGVLMLLQGAWLAATAMFLIAAVFIVLSIRSFLKTYLKKTGR